MKKLLKLLLGTSVVLAVNSYAMGDSLMSSLQKNNQKTHILSAVPQSGLLVANIDTNLRKIIADKQIYRIPTASANKANGSEYSDDYVPLNCQQLESNVDYSLPNTISGNSYCFYIPVKNIVKPRIVAYIRNQATNQNNDLGLYQDDPSNPGTFPIGKTSNEPQNVDEKVNMVSTAGHYYILITTQQSSGETFNFGLKTYAQTDQYESNGSVNSATVLTAEQPMTANIDSPYDDLDFYKYTAQKERLVVKWKRNKPFHKFSYSLDNGATWQTVQSSNKEDTYGEIPTTLGQEVVLAVTPLSQYNPNRYYTFSVWDTDAVSSKVSGIFGLIEHAVDSTGKIYRNPIPGYVYNNNSWVVGSVRSLSITNPNYLRIRGFVSLLNGKKAKFRKITLTSSEFNAATGYSKNVHTDETGAFATEIPMQTQCNGIKSETQFIPGPEENKVFKFDMEYYELSADTVNGYKSLIGSRYFYKMCSVRYEQTHGYLNPFTFD